VPLSAHDRVGGFRVLSIVGTGRNCQVWECLNDSTGERRAIKILLDNFANDREHVGFLKHEFAVGRKLDHPQVIHIYDYQVARHGAAYLMMEFFPAENIKQLFLQVGVDGVAPYVAKIAEQCGISLGYLHDQGWVHRDVKPDNFLMNKAGQVKLIDFALAERRKGALGKLFPSRMKIQGTRSYMSPEQIRGKGVDERSDIYSLACMLHELVAGKPPFTGQTTQELLTRHLRTPAASLESTGRDVTREFSELILKMLAKEPKNRPARMNDILAALKNMKVFNRPPKPPVAQTAKSAADS
jgi:eukaryotic-like serine/threonine-protein kinase